MKALLRVKVQLAAALLMLVSCGGARWLSLAAGEPAPAPKKLNPDLVALPPNTWVKIKPNRNPEGRSFSGVCWGNGLIYYFGGGHHSYVGNDVELYDVAANTWTQATECEDWREHAKWTYLTEQQQKDINAIGGGSNAPLGILSPKGRPLTYHSYQQHAWFPEESAFYNLGQKWGMWAFDPVKREWSEATRQLPDFGDQSTISLVYDPGLKTVVALTGTRGAAAYAYNRETKAWVKKCGLPCKNTSVHTAYDSVRKVHVIHAGGQSCFTLDLATGTTKPMASFDEAVKAAGKPAPLSDVSMGYDPELKAALILNSDTGDKARKGAGAPVQVWAYDADKDNWAEVKMSGPTPTGDVRWGLLVYDTDHKCCLFVNVMGIQGSRLQGGPVDGLFAFRCNQRKELKIEK